MIFPRHTLENTVIECLQKGTLSTTDLLKLLREKRSRTTKQGMYAVLRKLIRAEVVLKHKQLVSLNIVWLSKLESFVSLAEHFYTSTSRSGNFLGLADGEKIKYEFQNPNVTDAFWNHVIYLLVEARPKQPWFAYNPHCWFFLARPESERALRDFIIRNGGQYLLIVGAKHPLDQSIRKEFDNEHSQYFMREPPLFPKNNYYLNIIGDYVIEVWIDPAQANEIEQLYASASETTEEIGERLQDIIGSKGKTKLVVSRDRKKAEKFRRMLSKPFYISKND